MLSVSLIWLYMFITTFILGYGILTCITRVCTYRIQRWDSYLICGFAGATVYAQFYSIFGPVGLAANLVMAGICLAIVFFCRKQLCLDLQQGIRRIQEEKSASGGTLTGRVIFICFLFVLYAYGTSRGILHYDTGLYHAQSIRWIEEYGVVKGLGNLHCRLAYNSASFALSALYSMAFLGGQSYHCAAGFLALILAVTCLDVLQIFKRKSLKPSDFARVMGIYYLLIIFDEMISPASDYFMVLTAFYIVIRWMDLLEAKEKSVFPYAMLCVLGVFLLTVKLSAALIILLVIKPAGMLIRGKRWKEIMFFCFLGILTAAPFLIRNVLLSGWLVYPFTGIDLFSVDWKIPQGIAAYDAKEIQVWGRGYSDVTKYDMPVSEWMPAWFQGLSGMDKLLVLAAMGAVAVFLLRFFLMLWQQYAKKSYHPDDSAKDRLLLEGVISFCFLFWLFTSPLIRYGCVYVYLVSAVVWGDVLTEILDALGMQRKMFYLEKACILMIGIFLLYKAAAFCREIAVAYVDDYWVSQKDYENFETAGYEIDGITFYYPIEGDQTGYESFPSSPVRANIKLRGDSIEGGFYYAAPE